MIASIVEVVESLRRPVLLYSKYSKLYLNAAIQLDHARKILPALVANVALNRTRIINEQNCVRLLLHRMNCGYAYELIKQFLKFNREDLLK